jgi:hypothetical protein
MLAVRVATLTYKRELAVPRRPGLARAVLLETFMQQVGLAGHLPGVLVALGLT